MEINMQELIGDSRLTPMFQQYFKIKEQHRDHILFFRLGDFYEMFFEDAIYASKELGLALTGRECGLQERAPMCGVPYHSSEGYVAKLIRAGQKVAICEQVEDPAFAKGVVSREVVRVITPGTLLENNMLQEDANNYLCCIYCRPEGYGLAFADISTGTVNLIEMDHDSESALMSELSRYAPREVIFNRDFLSRKKVAEFMRERLSCTADLLEDAGFEPEQARTLILEHFHKEELTELGLNDRPFCVSALGALLSYLQETQKIGVERLITLNLLEETKYMNLDLSARTNLELLETVRTGERRGSLLWVLDKTKTPMGKRLIKAVISQPLLNPAEIEKRLNAVEELCENEMLCAGLAEKLDGVFDMERLITRIVYGNAAPREYNSLAAAIGRIPSIKADLEAVKSISLTSIRRDLDQMPDLLQLLESAIDEEPSAHIREGGVIKAGFNEDLDRLRALISGSRTILAELEAQEKEKTGIKTLKIGYNRIFGYYLEVTKSNLKLVPDHYIRKQTLANCERYITEELKKLEQDILSAQERSVALEQKLFEEVRIRVARQLHRIQRTAGAVAWLDILQSFSAVALKNQYVRPSLNSAGEIRIKEGRHPVVEQILGGSAPFVPNDALLDMNENRIAVITGPNMAGKSTYMRQTALIVLMAQIGSFVPAAAASIGITDAIYTRIGAADDLSTGQSTFMVEMVEVATILNNATANSLLILDEIGRGTSTYDGMSIARAVIEYIADPSKLGAKTMFATHYHELTTMEQDLNCVKNYNTAVKKRGEDITFLRRIVRGAADDSYGIEVSKLAGIPDWIVKRAHGILEDLEAGTPVREASRRITGKRDAEFDEFQISLEGTRPSEVEQMLSDLNPDTLTPIEALTMLFKLREKARIQ